MKSIAFIDAEINPNNDKIIDIGSIKNDGSTFHSNAISDFVKYLDGTEYICGHNIIDHDLKYLKHFIKEAKIDLSFSIDTLYLSPLLFPTRPYHALVKDDKLQTDEINNPLNDSMKARDLLYDEINAFNQLDNYIKGILYSLLGDKPGFSGFFKYLDYKQHDSDIRNTIKLKFNSHICGNCNLDKLILENPIELAYSLALINASSRYSITPPWVLKRYPMVERVIYMLRSSRCLSGCKYCNESLNVFKGLKSFFGYDSFRTYGGEPLQEKAVNAAIENKSLLAVFPTGGGKSLTFQLPALMSGITSKGLTVVISPLQSLMKDQVDNLERNQITEAVTINGMLDPIERSKSIERVANGTASLLYISPESLRSRTIENLLLGRNVVRFVIDEAHCFSAWGQDFRVDYLYIGEFIKNLQDKKNLKESIPISCFTATAKQKVIEDIIEYFREKLSLELETFASKASRTNLNYKVFEENNEEGKYMEVRRLLEEKNCPTIIYVSRTKRAYDIAERLSADGYPARPFHGRMEKQEKIENQDAFISGEVDIIVATSAFGMGVDKKDVGMVIHFDISDSLENYIQEAGRAGRDENISADCFILFNDDDLNKHFMLLNQTKMSIKEIQQVWKAIKDLTRFKSRVSQSALEIARKAGWDDNISDIDLRVNTAISALEDAGYLKRGQNQPRIFADSILVKNAEEAINKISKTNKMNDEQKVQAIRIMKKLISSKSRKVSAEEVPESRVDHISDHLGIKKEDVIRIVNILREEEILADTKDMRAYINRSNNINGSLKILKSYFEVEKYLSGKLNNSEMEYNLKLLNEEAEGLGYEDITINKLKVIINFWTIQNLIKSSRMADYKDSVKLLRIFKKDELDNKIIARYDLSKFILEYLYKRADKNQDTVMVEFSILELKEAYNNHLSLLRIKDITIDDVNDSLFYLSRIEAIKIDGGFLVVYNPMDIERTEEDLRKRYKSDDYQKLKRYYQNRMEQIHIVGEYARKIISDYEEALQFVDDYFQLNYKTFLEKYFKGSKQEELTRNLTPNKFNELFGQLSPAQLNIIKNKDAKYIVVAAGPGSGKTRVLVHKLASLMLMEDVKHEQLLMLTFSRAASTEFKKRLMKLIGNAANFIEIKTFHSYCFDLLGRLGTIEKSDKIISETIEKINSGDVEKSRITKTVLVIDEAQDIDSDEFRLINTLIENNDDLRVIAVGDDDQNIYEFRGASSKYLEELLERQDAEIIELIENYRSKNNLVKFTNYYASRISKRLKKTPIFSAQQANGDIRIHKYMSNNLISPVVMDIIKRDIYGSTCILTRTNEEAMQIAGLLLENKVHAKLIQSNDGFSLYNLLEVRYFIYKLGLNERVHLISDESWEESKKALIEKYRRSSNLELVLNMLRDFEITNSKYKYKSDLEVFIRESKLEDFLKDQKDTIFVSTIHKAKGREFDNIILMINGFSPSLDEELRQLYVGMTRAKNKLIIHTNSSYFDDVNIEGIKRIYDRKAYEAPSQIVIQLTHRDIWLDYFYSRQNQILGLVSGDELIANDEGCSCINNQQVLKYSKSMASQIAELMQKGYSIKKANVRFVVFWQKEDADKEIKIILPKLVFEKL